MKRSYFWHLLIFTVVQIPAAAATFFLFSRPVPVSLRGAPAYSPSVCSLACLCAVFAGPSLLLFLGLAVANRLRHRGLIELVAPLLAFLSAMGLVVLGGAGIAFFVMCHLS